MMILRMFGIMPLRYLLWCIIAYIDLSDISAVF